MSNDWSSFEKDKVITDKWKEFLNEAETPFRDIGKIRKTKGISRSWDDILRGREYDVPIVRDKEPKPTTPAKTPEEPTTALVKTPSSADLTKTQTTSVVPPTAKAVKDNLMRGLLTGEVEIVSDMLRVLEYRKPKRITNLLLPLLGTKSDFSRLLSMDPAQLRENDYGFDFYKAIETRLKILFKMIKTPNRKLFLSAIIKRYWEIVNSDDNPHKLKSEEERRRAEEIGGLQIEWLDQNIKPKAQKQQALLPDKPPEIPQSLPSAKKKKSRRSVGASDAEIDIDESLCRSRITESETSRWRKLSGINKRSK
tara:strand:+ start:49964 stop:50893 length:930 start_codon:yes stop_codon:yes gene_type:complete